MSGDAFEALTRFLTAREATALAVRLQSGDHTSAALREISAARRLEAKRLMASASLGRYNVSVSAAVMQSIAGAKSSRLELTPVWTMPGNEATSGRLTGEFYRLIQQARLSVTCATYNFETTSKMWTVLAEAGERPGVVVTVYADGSVADEEAVRANLGHVNVYCSTHLPDGTQVRSHAKFVVIDHAMTLITSANFSFSAEHRNIELGLVIHDPALADSIESTMASKHNTLYKLIT